MRGEAMKCRKGSRSSLLALLVLLPLFAVSLAAADIVYLYDDLGRLVRVIRDDGESATWHYDSVGNITRITRESGVPQTTSVSGVSTSTISRNRLTTLTFTGFNFSGAIVTASTGITVTSLQAGVDTLTVEVSLGVAVDGQGNLFIADTDHHRVRRVSVDGTMSTVAGDGTPGFGGDGGPATSAQLFEPHGVAV